MAGTPTGSFAAFELVRGGLENEIKNDVGRHLLLVAAAFSGQASPSLAQSNVVTIYSADGLHDGTPSWFGNQFEAFTKATGIKVQYVEAGSGGVVDRLAKEKSNTQADVLVSEWQVASSE